MKGRELKSVSDLVREALTHAYGIGDADDRAPGEIGGVLLDSGVIIEALRGRHAAIGELRAIETRGIRTYCGAIAWAEVCAGRPGEEALSEDFFQARGEVLGPHRCGPGPGARNRRASGVG